MKCKRPKVHKPQFAGKINCLTCEAEEVQAIIARWASQPNLYITLADYMLEERAIYIDEEHIQEVNE
tara:strand:+ start:172 stop:372 length:201 start_codon:yes stop_codon:yes gene_type:complete